MVDDDGDVSSILVPGSFLFLPATRLNEYSLSALTMAIGSCCCNPRDGIDGTVIAAVAVAFVAAADAVVFSAGITFINTMNNINNNRMLLRCLEWMLLLLLLLLLCWFWVLLGLGGIENEVMVSKSSVCLCLCLCVFMCLESFEISEQSYRRFVSAPSFILCCF
jgi:hypothetical protein